MFSINTIYPTKPEPYNENLLAVYARLIGEALDYAHHLSVWNRMSFCNIQYKTDLVYPRDVECTGLEPEEFGNDLFVDEIIMDEINPPSENFITNEGCDSVVRLSELLNAAAILRNHISTDNNLYCSRTDMMYAWLAVVYKMPLAEISSPTLTEDDMRQKVKDHLKFVGDHPEVYDCIWPSGMIRVFMDSEGIEYHENQGCSSYDESSFEEWIEDQDDLWEEFRQYSGSLCPDEQANYAFEEYAFEQYEKYTL